MNNYLLGTIIVVVFIIVIVVGNWLYWLAMPVEPASQNVNTSET